MKIEFEHLSETTVLLKRQWQTKTDSCGHDTTGSYWMVMHAMTLGEPVYWLVDGQKVFQNDHSGFYAYFPPYSFTTEYVKGKTNWDIKAIVSSDQPPQEMPNFPCLLQTKSAFPEDLQGIEIFLKNTEIGPNISVCTKPTPLAQRIKQQIDQNFHNNIKMESIAKKMKSSNAYICRQFNASFGCSPNYYKKVLRVWVATITLMSGKSPTEAAAASGYQDLSRFYKQFGKLMKIAPGKYHK